MLWVVDGLSILLVLALGLITSYEDIKFNKIRNKWVLLAIVMGLFLLVLRVVIILLTGSLINTKYFTEFFMNLFMAFGVGILLWEMKLWNPADAKLFLAYAALMPLGVYQWGYTNYFPSFVILINTFVPYFFVYFGYIFFKTSLKEKKMVVKEIFKPKQLINFVVFIFAFSWFNNFVLGFLNIKLGFFLNIVLIFFIMVLLNRVLKINLMIAGVFITLLGVVLDYKTILTLEFLKQFISILFVFVFVRYFVINLGFHFFSKPVQINDLKPGMVPAEEIYKEKDKYKKRKLVQISFVGALFASFQRESLIEHRAEGLTKKDIQKIKQLHKKGKLEESELQIVQTVPFAPFIFFGVLLTILFKGNLVVALKAFLESFI